MYLTPDWYFGDYLSLHKHWPEQHIQVEQCFVFVTLLSATDLLKVGLT